MTPRNPRVKLEAAKTMMINEIVELQKHKANCTIEHTIEHTICEKCKELWEVEGLLESVNAQLKEWDEIDAGK